jgi:tetratricopeptide (TPR) repeat protein
MHETQPVIDPSPPAIQPVPPELKRSHSYPWKSSVIALAIIVLAASVLLYIFDPWHWLNRDQQPTVAEKIEEARNALDDRDFDLAMRDLQQCLQTNPFNAEVHFLTARTYRRAAKYAGWRKHLAAAEQLSWPRKQIELELRLYQAQIGNVEAVGQSLLQALEKLPPEKDLILEALGAGYLQNHDLVSIMNLTQPWIERAPQDWLPHLYRAHAQYQDGTRREAIEEYRKALALNPDQAQGQLWLAGALMNDGQFKESLALYEKYLEGNKGDPNALFGVANCQYSIGKIDAARQTLKGLLAVEPDFVKAIFLQAQVELAQDKPADALKWLRKAERFAPSQADINHTFVIVFERLNMKDEAAKYAKKQQEILSQSERLQKLRKEFLREPYNSGLRYQIGRLLMDLHRDGEAEEYLEMIPADDAHYPEAQKAIEEIRERNGEGGPSAPEKK